MTKSKSVRLAVPAAILLFGFQAINSVSGHEGHKHSHAPVTAKKLKNPVTADAAAVEAGKQLFEKHCAVCHGKDGQAKTKVAETMKPKPSDLTAKEMNGLTDGEIYWVATNGIKTSGMPAYKTKANDTERWQMTLYVKKLMGSQSHAEHAAKPAGPK